MSWIGTVTGDSPPSVTEAVTTEPHVMADPKVAHSAIGLPPDCSPGKPVTVSAEEKILRPVLPESRMMLSTVWQFVVPGTQIVTDTQGIFGTGEAEAGPT